MGPFSHLPDEKLAEQILLFQEMASDSSVGRDERLRWASKRDEAIAEQRRRADRIIVKHIGRSTWQGPQSEWEKRV